MADVAPGAETASGQNGSASSGKSRNWPAVVSFVLALGGLLTFGFTGIGAVAFGHIGLYRVRAEGGRGRRLALWGTVLGYLGCTVFVAFIVLIAAGVIEAEDDELSAPPPTTAQPQATASPPRTTAQPPVTVPETRPLATVAPPRTTAKPRPTTPTTQRRTTEPAGMSAEACRSEASRLGQVMEIGETSVDALRLALLWDDIETAQSHYDTIGWALEGHSSEVNKWASRCKRHLGTRVDQVRRNTAELEELWRELRSICRAELASFGFDC